MEEIVSCCLPVQLPYRMVPEISISNNEGWSGEVCRKDDKIIMRVEIGRDHGAERAGGSHTRSGKHTAEALDI